MASGPMDFAQALPAELKRGPSTPPAIQAGMVAQCVDLISPLSSPLPTKTVLERQRRRKDILINKVDFSKGGTRPRPSNIFNLLRSKSVPPSSIEGDIILDTAALKYMANTCWAWLGLRFLW